MPKKKEWPWDEYDLDVMVSDIWTTSTGDQPPLIFGRCRYQVSFYVDEELQEQLNPMDAELYRNSEFGGGADHNKVVQSFENDEFEWASNVWTGMWGVSRFTSSLSMKELEEKFNLVLPPYIKVAEFWRAVPRNYVSID